MTEGRLQALFPTPVYVRADVVNEEWQKDTIKKMESIDIAKSKIESNDLDLKMKGISFFGDADYTKDFGIDITWLKEEIKKGIQDFLQENLDVPVDRYDIHIQKWWPVVTLNEGGVSKHSHNNSHLSVVYYVRVPSSTTEKDPGCLTFYSDQSYWARHIGLAVDDKGQAETFITYVPTTGDLIIFPSHLEHSVTRNEWDEKRFSLSFDITITRNETEDDSSDEMALTPPTKWIKL